MLNPITNLATYVKAIGKAYIYTSTDPTAAANWSLSGITEGDMAVDEKFVFNDYKIPEWTGEAVHARDVVGTDISINVPLVWGADSLYKAMSPTGTNGAGRSKPLTVVPVTVAIIPVAEVLNGLTQTPSAAGTGNLTVVVSGGVSTGTFSITQAGLVTAGVSIINGCRVLTFNGTTSCTLDGAPAQGAGAWTLAAYTPAVPVHALWIHRATFEPQPFAFHHADGGKVIRHIIVKGMFDATKPEGQMLYTRGAPELGGITTYRI